LSDCYGDKKFFFFFEKKKTKMVVFQNGHIGWATSMPFASINSTNPRNNPWKFHKTILRIGDFEKQPFWKTAILDFFLLDPHENQSQIMW
jgi:hypothetical protein